MKKFIVLTSILLAMCCVSFGQANRPTTKVTAKSLFLDLPVEHLKIAKDKRAKWIDDVTMFDDYIDFTIAKSDLPKGASPDMAVFGSVKLMRKRAGGNIFAWTMNICARGQCVGQVRFFEVTKGVWNQVTDKYVPTLNITNQETRAAVKADPTFKHLLKSKDGVFTAVLLNDIEDSITYAAGCTTNCDQSVIVKQFIFTGEKFRVFNPVKEYGDQ